MRSETSAEMKNRGAAGPKVEKTDHLKGQGMFGSHNGGEGELIEKTLKQDEIDALFEAARSSTPEAPRTEVRARVVPYNFSSAGQISTEQLRAISMLNDLFARNLTHNLAAWLRTRFQVTLVRRSRSSSTSFCFGSPKSATSPSVRLEPLGALSVLQLDLGLALRSSTFFLAAKAKTVLCAS